MNTTLASPWGSQTLQVFHPVASEQKPVSATLLCTQLSSEVLTFYFNRCAHRCLIFQVSDALWDTDLGTDGLGRQRPWRKFCGSRVGSCVCVCVCVCVRESGWERANAPEEVERMQVHLQKRGQTSEMILVWEAPQHLSWVTVGVRVASSFKLGVSKCVWRDWKEWKEEAVLELSSGKEPSSHSHHWERTWDSTVVYVL